MQELLNKETKRGKPGYVTKWRDTVVLEKRVKIYAKHNYIPEEVKTLDDARNTSIVQSIHWKAVSWKPGYEPETALVLQL